MFLNYIPDWENKILACSGCGETEGVKYKITTRPGNWCKTCTYAEIKAHCNGGWRENEQDKEEGQDP